jgi:hypothetical protein
VRIGADGMRLKMANPGQIDKRNQADVMQIRHMAVR